MDQWCIGSIPLLKRIVSRELLVGAGLVLIALTVVQLIFGRMSEILKGQQWATVQSLLRNEAHLANSYQIARVLSDLERVGSISCVTLRERGPIDRAFYDTNHSSSCDPSRERISGVIKSINNLEWSVSYQYVPSPWFLLSKLLTVLLVLTVVISATVILKRMKAVVDKERQLLALRETQAKALHELSAQIAHDIRSPLSALTMVMGTLHGLPEEKRQIVRNATQRINDIANQLLHKPIHKNINDLPSNGDTDGGPRAEPVLLMTLIDAVVSEKRVQFREGNSIEIQSDLEQGYGLFAMINPSEFARVVSNLVNNSVEATSESGRITITIRKNGGQISVIVCDDGKGISPEVLKRLGERGVTDGKEGTQSGSGLGIYHARRTIEQASGSFLVQSKVGEGTSVTLTLPQATCPDWFAEGLLVPANTKVVSVDDDQTIHQIWAERLGSVHGAQSPLQLCTLSSLNQLEAWLDKNGRSGAIFLIDYEFSGQAGNGLEAVERLGIAKQAILVTSRFEDHHVRSRAQTLGLKILPKALAPFAPIEFVPVPS